MNLSFNGYNDNVLTFESDSVTKNYPVSLSANKKVQNASSGADFIGVATSVNGNLSGVQMDGYVEMAYSSTAPTLGFVGLVADGNGGVKVLTTAAKKYKVLTVDLTASTVGFIL